MSSCKMRSSYLAGLASASERVAFENHLKECQTCSQAVAASQRVEGEVKTWLAGLEVPEATPAKADALVGNILECRERGSRIRVAWALSSVAAVAVIVLVVLWAPWQRSVDTVELTVLAKLGSGVEVFEAPDGGFKLGVVGRGRVVVQVGPDRVGVGNNSRVMIVPAPRGDTRLQLLEGSVTVSAHKRSPDRSVAVEVGKFLVRVVGTSFMVERDAQVFLRIRVNEGKVIVVQPDGHRRQVRAGEKLSYFTEKTGDIEPMAPSDTASLKELLSLKAATKAAAPKGDDQVEDSIATKKAERRSAMIRKSTKERSPKIPKTKAPSHDEIRAWVIAGNYNLAESALRARLRLEPRSAEAWWLLGECLRKAGKPGQAVPAYEKVVKFGNAQEANRARYQAADLLVKKSGESGRAIQLLRDYLAQPGRVQPFAAEARLRLAKVLIAKGKKADAKALLQEVIEKHAGTGASVEALSLLEKLGRD